MLKRSVTTRFTSIMSPTGGMELSTPPSAAGRVGASGLSMPVAVSWPANESKIAWSFTSACDSRLPRSSRAPNSSRSASPCGSRRRASMALSGWAEIFARARRARGQSRGGTRPEVERGDRRRGECAMVGGAGGFRHEAATGASGPYLYVMRMNGRLVAVGDSWLARSTPSVPVGNKATPWGASPLTQA